MDRRRGKQTRSRGGNPGSPDNREKPEGYVEANVLEVNAIDRSGTVEGPFLRMFHIVGLASHPVQPI